MPTELTPALYAALSAYRAANDLGQDVRSVVRSVVEQLGEQRPAAIGNLDGAIATAAGLHWWHPKPSFSQRILRRRLSESELLMKTPGLEYLFLFHRNGRLREQALNRITGPLPNAFLFATVTWRLNDWVPQVRESAARCAQRCFLATDPTVASKFFAGTLHRLQSWARWNDAERRLLTDQLVRKGVLAELVRLLRTEHQGPLPSMFAYLIRYPEIDDYLSSIAESAAHPGVRAIAVRALINGEASYTNGTQWRWIDKSMGYRRKEPRIECRPLTVFTDRRALYGIAIADRSASLRRIALSGMIKHDLHAAETVAIARASLTDPSPSVRERASFIIKQNS